MASQDTDTALGDMAALEPSQESQGIDVSKVQKLLEQHKQNLKERRRQRQQAIIAAHNKRVEKLKTDHQRVKGRHDKALRAIRRPKMQHLLDLLSKKRDLEKRVEECSSQMESAFTSTAHKFQLAIEKRSSSIAGQLS